MEVNSTKDCVMINETSVEFPKGIMLLSSNLHFSIILLHLGL
jgi:hypothetical protein